MLSSCGSEQKEARFWGRVPQLRRMYTQGCYVAVRSAGSHTRRYAASSSSPSPEKVTLSSVLFFFRPKREVIFFTLTTRRDEGGDDLRDPRERDARVKTQMRKVEFQVWDRSDPRLFVIVKGSFWIRLLPHTTTNTTTTPPTNFTLAVSLLGYSAVRTKFPVLRFFI